VAKSSDVRKYELSDREQCRRLWSELTEWHREIYEDPTIGGEHPEDRFDEHLAKVGPERLWVATYNSQVVGLVGLIVEGEEAEIEPIIVGESYRRRGLGEKLLQKVVSEAKKMGIRFLCVKPVARNIEAMEFLYRQGFRSLGQIELCMDFVEYAWKPGPVIHECKFNL